MARCAGGVPVLLWCFGAGGRCWSWAVRCCGAALRCCGAAGRGGRAAVLGSLALLALVLRWGRVACCRAAGCGRGRSVGEDRKSVVEGKSVSVRVDLGGRCFINKKIDETLKTIDKR